MTFATAAKVYLGITLVPLGAALFLSVMVLPFVPSLGAVLVPVTGAVLYLTIRPFTKSSVIPTRTLCAVHAVAGVAAVVYGISIREGGAGDPREISFFFTGLGLLLVGGSILLTSWRRRGWSCRLRSHLSGSGR